MSKVLVVPDAHLKKDVIEKGIELADLTLATHIILLGDYFDDWESTEKQYYEMMEYLKGLLARNPNVYPLIGNHELSYLGFPCSGHTNSVEEFIRKKLENDRRFISCMAVDGVLYSHAGVTSAWALLNNVLTENELRFICRGGGGAQLLEDKIAKFEWDNKKAFAQVAKERGGKDPSGSCMWADLHELVNDPCGNIKQVVGHTPVKSIQHMGTLWFCDTQSNDNVCDEYLLVNDGVPSVISYDNRFNDERIIKKWK